MEAYPGGIYGKNVYIIPFQRREPPTYRQKNPRPTQATGVASTLIQIIKILIEPNQRHKNPDNIRHCEPYQKHKTPLLWAEGFSFAQFSQEDSAT